MKKRSRLLLTILASLSLTACATGHFEGAKLHCPPLKAYSAGEELKLAAEVAAAPSYQIWPTFMVDYRNLRSICRATEPKK